MKKAWKKRGGSEYSYKPYSPIEEGLLNFNVYNYDYEAKLGEMRLCEYCGCRPGITDEKLGRIACNRCKNIFEGFGRGVLIDDISDDDRLIALIGFRIKGLRDILFWEKNGPQIALNSPFNIAGKKLEWHPARMCERLHELYSLGERLKITLDRSLDRLIQEGFVENKYRVNLSGEIVDGTMVKDMEGSFLKIEFNGSVRACYLKDSDEKRVTLHLFGLTDKDKEKIMKCKKSILRNANFEANLRIMEVLETHAVSPQYRVWQIVNRLNSKDNSLTSAYIIPAKFTFGALTEIYDMLREYRIDDRVKIDGILTRVEREDYPLYMLIKEALQVALK